jgi:hypothetical protein
MGGASKAPLFPMIVNSSADKQAEFRFDKIDFTALLSGATKIK